MWHRRWGADRGFLLTSDEFSPVICWGEQRDEVLGGEGRSKRVGEGKKSRWVERLKKEDISCVGWEAQILSWNCSCTARRKTRRHRYLFIVGLTSCVIWRGTTNWRSRWSFVVRLTSCVIWRWTTNWRSRCYIEFFSLILLPFGVVTICDLTQLHRIEAGPAAGGG